MQWDIGAGGVALLVALALVFGIVAHLVAATPWTPWMWAVASGVYFVSGLLISEVWFGWATEEELQPNIDGLSFDEVFLIGLVPGALAVLLYRRLARRPTTRQHSVSRS